MAKQQNSEGEMQTSTEGKDQLGLLTAIREELESLAERAARNFQDTVLFARWDPINNEEKHKRWERLGLRILKIQSAVDRLQGASRLDAEVLRQISEQVVAVRAIWRGYDQELELEATAMPPDEDREATITDGKINAAERDAAFASVLGNLRELFLQVEK